MKLYFGKSKFWKCNLRQCDQQVGLRKDNCFEGSRIPFCSALRFIYCWCEELTSIKSCVNQLDLSDKTVIDWNNYMRELCVLDMDNKSNMKVGGPDCSVEIDESVLILNKVFYFMICRKNFRCRLVALKTRQICSCGGVNT